MTAVLVSRFADPQALEAAAEALADQHFVVVDAFTPFPIAVEGAASDQADAEGARFMAWAAAIGGLGAAALVYALEWFSAVIAYPFDSGDRPLHSWPVFLLAPFEIGVLAAAAAGLATFLWRTGLPRLNHPAFEIPGFERASQDAFFLAVAAPQSDERRAALAAILQQGDVWEGEL